MTDREFVETIKEMFRFNHIEPNEEMVNLLLSKKEEYVPYLNEINAIRGISEECNDKSQLE